MKTVTLINQNIPIWSVIKGDHACTEHKKLLHESLIKTPNFLDPRENALRETFLQKTKGRKWLYEFLKNQSFALVKLDQDDLETVLTVWKDQPLVAIAKEYKKAYTEKTGISYKEIVKSEENVIEVRRRKQALPLVEGSEWLTTFDESFDYHRGIWVKNRNTGKYQIVDGTHRCLATVWRYLLDKNQMPKAWYAMVCET